MKVIGNMQRVALFFALVSVPLVGVSAQGRPVALGGGMGGGGMGGGGFVDMTGMGGGGPANIARPLHYDLDGPFSFDSFKVLLTLDSVKHANLEALRTAHLAATAVMRDSVKKAATELGLTSGTAFSLTAISKPELSKTYDKQIKSLRKLDVAFFEKQVKPELNKDQYNALKTWYGQQRPIGQAARGEGGRGQGGTGGQGRGGRGPGGF